MMPIGNRTHPRATETFAAEADEHGWDHLPFLAAVLAEETGARETRGGADAVAVTAMSTRLVHHADVHVLRGDSYRLKDNDKDVLGPDTG